MFGQGPPHGGPHGHGHHGHGHHGHGHHGHGPHGGFGGPQFFQKLAQQFINNLNDYGRSSSSDESEEKQPKRAPQKPLRPVVINSSEQLYALTGQETTIVDVTIENKSKWPLQVESIKKIEPSEIEFESIEVGQKLNCGEQSKLSIPIKMPSQPGHYTIKLGFFNRKG